eukprot:363362-Chlamydomonas_euryale.AAC.10
MREREKRTESCSEEERAQKPGRGRASRDGAQQKQHVPSPLASKRPQRHAAASGKVPARRLTPRAGARRGVGRAPGRHQEGVLQTGIAAAS